MLSFARAGERGVARETEGSTDPKCVPFDWYLPVIDPIGFPADLDTECVQISGGRAELLSAKPSSPTPIGSAALANRQPAWETSGRFFPPVAEHPPRKPASGFHAGIRVRIFVHSASRRIHGMMADCGVNLCHFLYQE